MLRQLPFPEMTVNVDELVANTSLQIKYASSDVGRHKRNFTIGFFTIVIVVCFVSLMQCIARGSNYLILRIAEKQVGEQDMEIAPDLSATDSFLINQTELDLAMIASGTSQGAARWLVPARAAPDGERISSTLDRSIQESIGLSEAMCYVIALDDVHEKEIHLGRSWDYPPLGEDETIISSSLADAMNLQIGDKILVNVNISQFLAAVSDHQFNQLFASLNTTSIDNTTRQMIIAELRSNITIQRDFTIVNTITSPEGKWPTSYGSVAVISLNKMRSMIKGVLNDIYWLSSAEYTQLDEIDPFKVIDNLAMQYLVLSNMHQSIYTRGSMNTDYNQYANDLMKFFHQQYDYSTSFLLYTSLQSLTSVTILLEQVFIMIDIIITIVAAYVIYILMLSSVKEKIFEMALLRIIGLQRRAASGILFIQVLYFTIPGIIIGLLLSIGLYLILAIILNQLLLLNIPLTPPTSAYILSILVGFLSPLIAIVAPVYSLSKQKLVDSLDYQHSDVNDTRVKVSDCRKTPITIEMILFGIILLAVGIMVFVFAVEAFLNSNMKTFMTILNILLIFALLGTIILSSYLSHWLSVGFSFVLTRIGSLRSCMLYIRNNTNLHKNSNIRLALLNTISLTFIIFAACLLRMQSNTLYANIKLAVPSDLMASSVTSLNQPQIEEFLINEQNRKFINNYEFLGSPITSNSTYFQQITTYADFNSLIPSIYYLTSNFLTLIDQDMIVVSMKDSEYLSIADFLDKSVTEMKNTPFPTKDIRSNPTPIIDIQTQYQLYVPALLPASINTDLISKDLSTFVFTKRTTTSIKDSIQLQNSAKVQKLPGFSFSKYNFMQAAPSVILSESSFSSILGVATEDINYPKDRLVIQLNEGLTDRDYAYVVDNTRSMLQDTSDAIFTERRSLIHSIDDAQMALDIYFYVVSALCCVLLFFATWISIETSSRDTSHEIGIFQALGGTRKMIYTLFIIESLSTLYGSTLCGILIGVFVALLVSIQMNLLTEVPISAYIPYWLLIGIFVFSSVLCIIASIISVHFIVNQPIAYTAKGGRRLIVC